MKINKTKIAAQKTVETKGRRGRPRKVDAVASKQVVKKPAAQVKESPVKESKKLSRDAKKLFMDARKPVSMLKKMSKEYSKLLSEAMKLGDKKTVNHINKLFGYLGYSFAEDKVNFSVSAKVKVPKVKTPRGMIPHAQKEETAQQENIDEVISATVGDVVLPPPEEIEPEQSKEIVVDAETAEKLANGEISEDDLTVDDADDGIAIDEDTFEDDDEDDEDLMTNDDDRETDIDDEQAEYRREFFGSVADNGDDWN